MTTMKLGDALGYFRGIRQDLIERKKQVIGQRNQLQKEIEGGADKAEREEKIATLELSLEGLSKQEDENYKMLNKLTEQFVAVWNAEVAKQQADAGKQQAVDLAKILEVARRISRGDKVPQKDEQKLMDYSPELYEMAKSMAALNAAKKRKEHKSLWEDEEEQQTEYDPQGKAENAMVSVNLPESVDAVEDIVFSTD